MTTLLYDPATKTLYADSQSTSETVITGRMERKIKAVNAKGLGLCLVACSGWSETIPLVLHWLTGERESKPDMAGTECELLILDSDGDLFVCGHKTLEPYQENSSEIHASGSGWLIAFSVMTATNDPLLAMSTARKLDTGTGGAIMCGRFVDGAPVIERAD